MKYGALLYTIIISYLLLSYSVLFLFDVQTVSVLTKEDGLFETLGALFFLLASVLFLITFLKDKRGNNFYYLQTNRNVFFLLLAFLFFLAFAEEISWGQRLFDLQTPDGLKKLNIQKEINIHNLSIFHGLTADGERKSFWGLMLSIDRLFSLFWFTFCFLVPIVNKTNTNISKWLETIGLPIIPIGIGVVFMFNYLISKIVELYTSPDLIHSVVEIKECNFASFFVVVSLWFLTNDLPQRKVRF